MASADGHVAPAAFPPPVDSQREFIKRGLDDDDELIEVGVAIVGGATAGLACANRLLQLLADDPETMERLGEVPVAVIEKGEGVRRAQPLGRGHAPGAAAGALPAHRARALARGGLRVRRGDQGGGLPHAQRQAGAEDPDPAAVQEPRQRGRLGRRDGALPAAPGRGGRRLRPHRDVGHAADRRGRPASSACARATRAAARTASRSANFEPGTDIKAQVTVLGRGLLGPPHRRGDPRVRPRRRPRAAGLGARGQGGLEGRQAAGPRHPHGRPVAAQGRRQVRADRRHVDLPDEGRQDGRRSRLDRLRRRPRVRRRDDLGPRPAAAVQAPPDRPRDPRGRRARRLGREGAPGRRLLVDAEAHDARSAARRRRRRAWSTPSRSRASTTPCYSGMLAGEAIYAALKRGESTPRVLRAGGRGLARSAGALRGAQHAPAVPEGLPQGRPARQPHDRHQGALPRRPLGLAPQRRAGDVRRRHRRELSQARRQVHLRQALERLHHRQRDARRRAEPHPRAGERAARGRRDVALDVPGGGLRDPRGRARARQRRRRSSTTPTACSAGRSRPRAGA